MEKEEKYYLDYNPRGELHSPDLKNPVEYWKLKDFNGKIKYRSTIDERFTNYDQIKEPIYINGRLIN